jgi:hypothetical protein
MQSRPHFTSQSAIEVRFMENGDLELLAMSSEEHQSHVDLVSSQLE